jgi:Family of unknown function (DUF5681)
LMRGCPAGGAPDAGPPPPLGRNHICGSGRAYEWGYTMDNGKSDRGRDGRFKKGQSGNPGGRPKALTEVKQAAREHTETALETLLSVLNNEEAPAAARISAACAILDRGWGKPGQYVETSVRNKPPEEMTDEELMEAIAAARDARDAARDDSDDEPETDPEQLN